MTLEPVVSIAMAFTALPSDRPIPSRRFYDGRARSERERLHVIRVALGCVVGIFASAMERIFGDAGCSRACLFRLSKMETRTLSVPKSTPATMVLIA